MAPEYYVFTGQRVPDHITHVRIGLALNFVAARAFKENPYIEEVICHDGVRKIEQFAFFVCPSLRRVIIPGVKEVEMCAFNACKAPNYIECDKLEVIGREAFCGCSFSSIDLPSIKIVEAVAFFSCKKLINVKFGKDLVSIRTGAFKYCRSLERITLPLKDGIFADDNIFQGCEKLNHVDLVGGVHEAVAALLLEDWKNDMKEELNSINQILPSRNSGNNFCTGNLADIGDKTRAIRTWITTVLRKIIHYKSEHRRYLDDAATTLQRALPNDIILKNVLPFLELPSYTFEGED